MSELIENESHQNKGTEGVRDSYSRFLLWFEKYNSHLWTLSLFPSWNKDDVSNEFLDILLQIRKLYLQNPDFEELEGLQVFWKLWNRRGHDQARKKGRVQLWVPLMLFGFKWNLSQVSKVTGYPLSHVRFLTLEALRNIGKNPTSPLSLSRDCLRSDLFIIEQMLGESWTDAFQVFGPKQLGEHLNKCPRCSKQLKMLQESSKLFKSVQLEELPRFLEASITRLQLPESKLQLYSFRYRLLGFFPKLVLQGSIAIFVLAFLTHMPFLGDIRQIHLSPQIKNIGGEFGGWASRSWSHVSGTWDAVVEKIQSFEFKKTTVAESALSNNENLALSQSPTGTANENVAANTNGSASKNSEDLKQSTATAPSASNLSSAALNKTQANLSANSVPTNALSTNKLALNSPQNPLRDSMALVPGASKASAKTPMDQKLPPATASATATSPKTALTAAPLNNTSLVAKNSTESNSAKDKTTDKKVVAEKIFLRWGAFTNELDEFKPKILEILSRYNAEMAGDLPLGAEYRGGRYFHFRIPEEHKELLKKEIAALKMKNFYVDTAKSNRDEIPGKIRIVFLVRTFKSGD